MRWIALVLGLLFLADMAQAANYSVTHSTDTADREAALVALYQKECRDRLAGGPKDGAPALDASDLGCTGTEAGKQAFITYRFMNVVDSEVARQLTNKRACRGTDYDAMTKAQQTKVDEACASVGK